MEAIMKKIQHQLKQKQEQKASLLRQLEAVKRVEEQLQQTLQILSSYSAPKEEAASSSTIKNPKEDIQKISSDESQKQESLTKVTKKSTIPQDFPPLQTENKDVKKWYVIFNGANKGIYDDWGISNSFIPGQNVIHKSYKTKNEA